MSRINEYVFMLTLLQIMFMCLIRDSRKHFFFSRQFNLVEMKTDTKITAMATATQFSYLFALNKCNINKKTIFQFFFFVSLLLF